MTEKATLDSWKDIARYLRRTEKTRRAGEIEQGRKILSEIRERSKKEYVSPTELASAYGALGDKETAFALFDKAYA